VVALVEIVNRLGDRADEKTRRDVVAVCRKAAENPALSVASEGMKAILSLSPDKSADVLHDFEPIWGTSRSAFVRVALIRALAGGSYEQVGARLIRFANDANAQVASEALDVLAPFAKAAAEPGRRDEARLAQLAGVARKCATSSDPAIAANALQLLQICGDKSDLPLASDVAARLAGDEAAEARVDAVHVAAAIGGKEAQAMLNIARSDPSPSVRAAADQEWKRLGFTDEPPPPSRTSGPPGAESDGGGRPSSVALEPGVDFLSSKPDPRVVLHFTAGDVVIELLREQAPHHVKAILERVRAGACNGLPIHRVVTGFVVQGLDPRGDGWGTGGVFLRDEINREPYVRGSVGMPNAGPDSGGCQVFVTVVPTPHLDGRYTVFGRVVSGMDVVDALDVSNVCTKAEVIQ
jgi:cyclophilin family peptidyl-prolyl cis-trans isomerase